MQNYNFLWFIIFFHLFYYFNFLTYFYYFCQFHLILRINYYFCRVPRFLAFNEIYFSGIFWNISSISSMCDKTGLDSFPTRMFQSGKKSSSSRTRSNGSYALAHTGALIDHLHIYREWTFLSYMRFRSHGPLENDRLIILRLPHFRMLVGNIYRVFIFNILHPVIFLANIFLHLTYNNKNG